MSNGINKPKQALGKFQDDLSKLSRIETSDDIKIGAWYLLDQKNTDLFFTETSNSTVEILSGDEVLVCVESFESNLVVFKSNYKEYRVLNKNLGKVLRDVSEGQAFELIQGKTQIEQGFIISAQQEIHKILSIVNSSGAQASEGTELIVSNKNAIIEQSKALKDVHGANITKLNESIKNHVNKLHSITQYYALPATVGISKLGKSKKIIDNKLHELSLYGGIKEEEIIVCTGGVVHESKPIHIYQNLKYMDVEGLLGYETGGINNNSIADFNEWLAHPVNRDRILPSPKSIVAIKVRKYPETKSMFWGSSSNDTYLYLRNGENITAIKSNISIGDTLLTTDQDMIANSYVKKTALFSSDSRSFDFLSKNEYEEIKNTAERLKPLYLNTLLSMYRERLVFQEKMLSYAEHRHTSLISAGKNNPDRFSDRIIEKTHIEFRGDYKQQDSQQWDESVVNYSIGNKPRYVAFEEKVEKHKERMEETKQTIKVLVEAIKGGFVKPNMILEFPSLYATSEIPIGKNEIGFMAYNGTRHEMQYTKSAHAEKMKAMMTEYQSYGLSNPNSHRDNDPFSVLNGLEDYLPMNEDNYFFDDLKALSWQRYKRQNDLAILIQGLLDRGSFFGYTQANLFKDGFEDKIKLVYDKDKGLYDGDMPDFLTFIEACNEDSKVGDTFYGHSAAWNKKEEDKRDCNRFYDRIEIPPYLPAEKIIKKRDGRIMVKFRWETEREWYSKAKSDTQAHNFECEISELINVSNYNLGECAQFVNDPRCRDQYPAWGEFVMAAERYQQKISKG